MFSGRDEGICSISKGASGYMKLRFFEFPVMSEVITRIFLNQILKPFDFYFPSSSK